MKDVIRASVLRKPKAEDDGCTALLHNNCETDIRIEIYTVPYIYFSRHYKIHLELVNCCEIVGRLQVINATFKQQKACA